MANEKDKFEEVVKRTNIPILTLDNMWHRLFTQTDESGEMKRLEEKLNQLLKEQGKINSETKDLKKIKTELMDGIVSNMDAANDGSDPAAKKKVDEGKRLINEINEKLASYDDRKLDLPREMEEVNRRLMLLTMEECYDLIRDNTRDIDEIGGWIKDMRMELKRNILKKQHMEIQNVELYMYMQGIFGPDVVDIFDIEYDIEAKRQALIAKHEAIKEEKAREAAKGAADPTDKEGL